MDWQAYAQLEPWGEERMDLRFANLMALLANIVRDPKKPAYATKDFLLDFLSDADAIPQGQTVEQQQALLEQVVSMAGGKVFTDDVSDEEVEAYLFSQGLPETYEEDEDNAESFR